MLIDAQIYRPWFRRALYFRNGCLAQLWGVKLWRRGCGIIIKRNRLTAVIPASPESASGSGIARVSHNVLDSLVLVK